MVGNTKTIEAALAAYAGQAREPIRCRFSSEADRLATLRLRQSGICFDWSRLDLDTQALSLLHQLADANDLDGARTRLAAGAIVNTSEHRGATHMAERGSGDRALAAQAAERDSELVLLAETIRAGEVRHVLHIGIGGSALGPALLVDALGRDSDGPKVEIVSNIDGEALLRATEQCDPATTLIVIVSKTFTTAETLTNADSAIAWLTAAGVNDAKSRCVAVTAAPDRARAWGTRHVLGFNETVGGRYSLWSAVGLPFAVRAGPEAWAALKAGARAMDTHFLESPWGANAPVLAAMADVWAARFCGQQTRGVFAYDDRLRMLPKFLQQLEMESNGKRVNTHGMPVDLPTAPVTWGGTGTDCQHAVFQLLHQGTVAGPVEFVAVRMPGSVNGRMAAAAHHRQLLANCLAQGAALLAGRSAKEALALAGGDIELAGARTFPGNRPSSTILLDRLDPHTLGALLAFYEHRTFAAAVMMGINPFDQWGVELGKELANRMLNGTLDDLDPSTAALFADVFAD